MTAEREGVHVASSPTRCPYCHTDVAPEATDWVACRTCLARHHAACWREQGNCAACSRPGALRPAPLVTLATRADAAAVVAIRSRERPGRRARAAGLLVLGLTAGFALGRAFPGADVSRARAAAQALAAEESARERASVHALRDWDELNVGDVRTLVFEHVSVKGGVRSTSTERAAERVIEKDEDTAIVELSPEGESTSIGGPSRFPLRRDGARGPRYRHERILESHPEALETPAGTVACRYDKLTADDEKRPRTRTHDDALEQIMIERWCAGDLWHPIKEVITRPGGDSESTVVWTITRPPTQH